MTSTINQPQSSGQVVKSKEYISWLGLVVCAAILLGVIFRFYAITQNTFVFYDEGMWLLQSHSLVESIEQNSQATLSTRMKLLDSAFHASLQTGKALWAYLSMLRGFFVGADGYFFTRVISAVLGVLTIGLVFLFGRKFYQSTQVALIAAALVAIMPTHIFYSRLALQESFSAFFFLLGIYLYVFALKISPRVVLAGVCFAAVYFVNYRMIIIPFFLGCSELYLSWAQQRRVRWKNWLCTSIVFAFLVFGVGALDDAANLRVTFGWMFHQGELAKGTFAITNLLSYPYYMWTFEGAIFASVFWSSIILLIRRRWQAAFPFVLVVLFMGVFSLPQEKGVRYVTSALPFVALAVAWMLTYMNSFVTKRSWQYCFLSMVIIMALFQIFESWHITRFSNNYEAAILDQRKTNPKARFVSTQSMIQRLYVDDKKDVAEFRYHMDYMNYLAREGYDFLILGPQAYVSFTPDDLRFQPKLKGFLQFIRDTVPAEQEYTHFNNRLLKRFVLEHNENLVRSWQFLRLAKENGYGQIRVYDLRKVMLVMNMAINQSRKK